MTQYTKDYFQNIAAFLLDHDFIELFVLLFPLSILIMIQKFVYYSI